MDDIFDRVKKIIVEKLCVDEEKVVEGANFMSDLGADSLESVELMMTFEEEFGIEIEAAAIEKMQTVRDVVDYIRKNTLKG
jgi:acyl carrier protein